MDSKYIPSFVMLSAGTIVCIISVINKFSLLKCLISLLLTMIVFYLLGCMMKKVLDNVKEANEAVPVFDEDEAAEDEENETAGEEREEVKEQEEE